jgi:hypothetical protein
MTSVMSAVQPQLSGPHTLGICGGLEFCIQLEWSDEGPISKLTTENIERAWLEVTNDGNESELGIFRQTQKSAPNKSHEYHNALRMYKANLTSNYLVRKSERMMGQGKIERTNTPRLSGGS